MQLVLIITGSPVLVNVFVTSSQCAPGVSCIVAGHGANIDMPREEDNRTPLHIAVNEGHVEVVAALLEAGAKVRQHGDTKLALWLKQQQQQRPVGVQPETRIRFLSAIKSYTAPAAVAVASQTESSCQAAIP